MNPLLVTLVPVFFALMLYFSGWVESTFLTEAPIEIAPIPEDAVNGPLEMSI